MPTCYWPLADLRVTNRELELRPMTEADLQQVADVLPDDLELDPAAPRFGEAATARGVVAYQTYWKALGTWTPTSWALHFVVLRDGRIIGSQILEGEDFLTLRTVDSASWLVRSVRGQGVGRAMREAVLALAFGPLGARAAVSSAWHDNHASLGVSRALGYRDNGEVLQAREGVGADVMIHVRLTREDWIASGRGSGVMIDGFEPCRHLFGFPPAPDSRR